MNANERHHNPDRRELLAGYADGELSARDRAAVESWLDLHPEAKADLDAQCALSPCNRDLWQRAAVPTPSESQWCKTLGRVRTSLLSTTLPSYSDRRTESARRGWRRLLAVTSIAAAGLIAVFMWPSGTGGNLAGDDVLAIATPADVNIISLQGDDCNMVVIGALPIIGPLDLVTVGEVALEAIQSDPDGRPVRPAVPSDPKKRIWIDPLDKTTPVP